MRLAVRSIGFVSTIILARLLVPADFGLVAIATMMVAMLELLGELSFETFLIRERDPTRDDYDTAWTLMVLRGVVTGLLLLIAAPYIAEFFKDARLEDIVRVLAALSVINGLPNIGIVDFHRELRFDRDFRMTVWTRMAGFVVTVSLAVALRDYWALVIGMIFSRAVWLMLSYTMHPFRPRFCLRGTRKIFRFSKWLLANNILSFAQRRSDVAVIGRFFDSASLGLYSVALEIARLITSELLVPIQRVLLPGLAALVDGTDRVYRAFFDSLAVSAMLGLPLAAGVGLVADPLVRLVLGDKWLGAIPLLQILAVIGVARVFRTGINALFLANNRPQWTTLNALIGAAIGLPLIVWSAWQGTMMTVALAVAAGEVISTLVTYGIVWRVFGLTPAAVLARVWRPVVACLAMGGAVYALLDAWPGAGGTLGLAAQLSGAAGAGAVVYLVTELVLWRFAGAPAGPESQVLAALRAASVRCRLRLARPNPF